MDAPEPPRAPLRVVVVGARRQRQGTGPFLALQAAAAGAELRAVWGTSAETAEQARAWLAERGANCQAYADWNRLLARERPEAVILACPRDTHAAWLESALRARLHVLCEKPLMPARPARALAADFAAAGLLLAENCQWPFTLPAFRALHPEVELARVTRFRMGMSPAHQGLERWLELLSHPLSLLQAVAPGPVELARIRFHDAGHLEFAWRTHQRELACEVQALPSEAYPRPAEYSFDGALLCRRILQPGYRFSFADERGREVPGVDPTPLRVADFLRRAAEARLRAAAPLDEDLVRRQELFGRILAAWPA